MTPQTHEQKAVRSVRIVTTRGVTYVFALSDKSRLTKLRSRIIVEHPEQMKVTVTRVGKRPPFVALDSTTLEATIIRFEVRTTYVKEVREE